MELSSHEREKRKAPASSGELFSNGDKINGGEVLVAPAKKPRNWMTDSEIFFDRDLSLIPELPIDVIAYILAFYVQSSVGKPAFLQEFVRCFRVSKLFLAELDREYYWKILVNYIAEGWCYKAMASVQAYLTAYPPPLAPVPLYGQHWDTNAELVNKALSEAPELIEEFKRSLERYNILGVGTVDIIKKQMIPGNYKVANSKFAVFDARIIHQKRNVEGPDEASVLETPFGSDESCVAKIGDVSLSKRKICSALLLLDRPTSCHAAVRFLVCMQCIPSYPSEMFKSLLSHPMSFSPKYHCHFDLSLYMCFPPGRRWTENTQMISWLENEIMDLKSLLMLVQIYSNEIQPWSEARRPAYAGPAWIPPLPPSKLPNRPQVTAPSVQEVAPADSPMDAETKLNAPEDRQKEEFRAVEEIFYKISIGELASGCSGGYSYCSRSILSKNFYVNNMNPHVPAEKFCYSYATHALETHSDRQLESMLKNKWKDAKQLEAVRYAIVEQMSPHSLGFGLLPLEITPDYGHTVLNRSVWLAECRTNMVGYAMYRVFVEVLIKKDPFILWTISRLARVCKAFNAIFGCRGELVWRRIAVSIRQNRELKAFIRQDNSTTPNEVKLLKQVGVDPSTYVTKMRDNPEIEEYVTSLTEEQDSVIQRLAKIQLRTYPEIPDQEPLEEPTSALVLKRIMLFYRLPRDRLFSFFNSHLVMIKDSPNKMTFMCKNIYPCVVAMSMKPALTPFNFCGNFGEYLKTLKRSREDREVERAKILCQMKANVALRTYITNLSAILQEKEGSPV